MKYTEIDELFYDNLLLNKGFVLRYLSENDKETAVRALFTVILGCITNRRLSTIVVFAIRNVEAEYFKIEIVKLLKASGMEMTVEQKHTIRIRGKKFVFTGKSDNYQNFTGQRIDAVIEP